MNFKRIISVITAGVLSVSLLASCGGNKAAEKKPTDIKDAGKPAVQLTANNKTVSVLPTQLGVNEETAEKYLINYEEVARSQKSILYADMQKGSFALQDIETEEIWYSTPNDIEVDKITKGTVKQEIRSQILLYYILKEEESTVSFYRVENSQTSCVTKDGIKVEKITNGIRVTYSFMKSEITVPVEYTLLEDGFSARIDVENIDEGKSAYLIGINLLPNFGAGNWATEGYLFVPDGSGALIPFNGHKNMATAYNFNLYDSEHAVMSGKDKKVLSNENFRMPVFGTVKNSGSLMGIITKGDTSASITAVYGTESNGYNAVSSVLNYRSIDSNSMFKGQPGIERTLYRVSKEHCSEKAYEVVYHMLKNGKSGYAAMADKYREYLLENKLLTKSESITPAFNLELYGAADISSTFLGIKYSKNLKLTRFNDAQKILSALTDKGIKNINVRYIGWSGDGILNKKMNTNASPLGKLGGKGAFRDLSKYMDSISAVLYPDIDPVSFRKSGNGVSVKKNSVHTMFNYACEEYVYSKSVYVKLGYEDSLYYLNGASVLNTTEKLLNNYSKAGIKNISFSLLGNALYSDFGEKNGQFRDITAEQLKAALERAAEGTEKTAVDKANAYAFKYADKIWNSPVTSSGYSIYKTDVPFYQMVLHGYTSMTTPEIMQSQDPYVTFLKAVESGIELKFDGTYSKTTELIGSRYEGLYSTCYTNWLETAADMNSRYLPLLEKIYSSTIVNHYEVQDGLFITEYDNGVKTAVNYNSYDCTFNGQTVKSMDFTVSEGEKK